MTHDYTDEEINEARIKASHICGYERDSWLKYFIDALPERPQAQPSPWPGQQEAIDAAFQQIDEFYLDYKSSHDDWEHEAPARLAIAQAYDKARPQAAEIASLKAELAALRTPILADDGRSLGRVAFEAWGGDPEEFTGFTSNWQAAAQAVAAVVLAQAVRRMEEVSVRTLADAAMEPTPPYGLHGKAESIRARLIAAAKGEGQANEIPQAEAEPAQPWTPAVGDTVRLKSGGPVMTVVRMDSEAYALWMNGKNIMGQYFPTACLTPAQP